MSDVNPSAAGDNANGMALTDSIYNRLLKERIIWLYPLDTAISWMA